MPIEAGRQSQPYNCQAGLDDSLWHCVLTANTECIDTFYTTTSATSLVVRISDETVIDRYSQEWEDSPSHGDSRPWLLSDSIHSVHRTASFHDLRLNHTLHSLTETSMFTIKCHCVSHPVRPHVNREHLFTDGEPSAATFTASLWKEKRRKGKPPESLRAQTGIGIQRRKGFCHIFRQTKGFAADSMNYDTFSLAQREKKNKWQWDLQVCVSSFLCQKAIDIFSWAISWGR